jgi:hypothetical protein
MFRRALRLASAAVVAVALISISGTAGSAAAKCRGVRCGTDATPPVVSIATPSAGHLVAGTVSVSGTSSDNVAVSAVSVSVDGGAWSSASGSTGWSWSWATSTVPNGSHVITARAVDTSGNAATTTVSVTVANPVPDTVAPVVSISAPGAGSSVAGTLAVSGTASDNVSVVKVEVRVDSGSWVVASGTATWSWSWATTTVANGTHTLAARATDGAGNVSTTTRTLTVSNEGPPPTVWTSPEGVTIDIRTTAGDWTPGEIYSLLSANARDLSRIGPSLRVVVQDRNPTITSTAASSVNGVYTSVNATITLDARATSGFTLRPDDILAHEYGHLWVNYHLYLKWQGDWSAYLAQRWTTSDGSVTLATDSRTGSSYNWSPSEVAADDYRLLFGSPTAISQRNASLNQQIPDPRSQPGLDNWFLGTWAG